MHEACLEVAVLPLEIAEIDQCHACVEASWLSLRASWLSLWPAGSPEASLAPDHASGWPELRSASASLGQSATWVALAGHTGPGFFDLAPPAALSDGAQLPAYGPAGHGDIAPAALAAASRFAPEQGSWLLRAEAVKLTAERADALPSEGRHMPVTGPEDMLAGMLAAELDWNGLDWTVHVDGLST